MRQSSEQNVQAIGVRLLKLAGFAVYTLSQGYRREPGGTRQTAGLPDVFAMHPAVGAVWWEAKSRTGHRRESQVAFGENAEYCGVRVLVGTDAAVRDYLRELRFLYQDPRGVEMMNPTWWARFTLGNAAPYWPEGYPKAAPRGARR